MIDEEYNPVLSMCIDRVWCKFKNLSGVDLSRITHAEYSGWWTAYQEYRDIISDEDMVKDITI